MRDLGFARNESARQLRAGRSRTIGLVVPNATSLFFTDLARGVQRGLIVRGFDRENLRTMAAVKEYAESRR